MPEGGGEAGEGGGGRAALHVGGLKCHSDHYLQCSPPALSCQWYVVFPARLFQVRFSSQTPVVVNYLQDKATGP